MPRPRSLRPPLHLLSLTCASFAAVAAAAAPPQHTPNFLFIYTDDQRWDAMSVVQEEQGDAARFPWFRTPHMDRLAVEGMRFRNAFVTNSLCSPSRAVFLTGVYNHLNGVANNQVPFPEHNVTYATVLRAQGYETAYIGKWHMDRQRAPHPGFDYSASYTGQGPYFDPTFVIDGEDRAFEGFTDDIATDLAIDFLRQPRQRPFALVLGFKSGHVPFTPPPRAAERFAGESFGPAPNFDSFPPHQERDPNATRGGWWSRLENDERTLNHFRLISSADDNLGRVLDALDDSGLVESTVVVYSSDNGFYLGEHNLGDKRSAYEESMRIPLLVRYPPLVQPGSVNDDMVLNLDIAPTFIHLAGLTIPSHMQGRSLQPLLAQQGGLWRQSFLYQYFWEAKFPGTPTLVAIRTPQAKLIRYHDRPDWTELFNLQADPYETRNLAHSDAHRDLLQSLQRQLDFLLRSTQYHIPEYADQP